MTQHEFNINEQVDQIKAMLFKNIQMIADYVKSPENERKINEDQYKKLVWRTEMLTQILKDVE